MRKKIDYSKLTKNAVNNLKKINELAKKFSKFESTKGVQEELEEIEMLTSDTIKKLNKLPEDAKKDIYYTTGIDEIEESDQGISEGRAELLETMLALVEEIMEESGRYFNLDREEYVEFEDEIKEL